MSDHKTALRLSVVALSVALLSGPAVAADVMNWDADGDGRITSREFRDGFEGNGLFDRWDTDRDGALSSAEIDTGLGENQEAFYDRFGDDITSWDRDADGLLDRNEFYNGAFSGYSHGGRTIEEPELSDFGDDIGDGGFWDV